jgi:uncharacterized membrane protein YkvA (DUF1232 family)
MKELSLSRSLESACRPAMKAAAGVLRRRLRLLVVLHAATMKLLNNPQLVATFRNDVRILVRMLGAWASRRYLEVPWRSLMLAAGAVIYFLNPVDLIPDAIVGIGYVDDIAVVGAVMRAIHEDLEAFAKWESVEAEPLRTAA